MDSRDWDRRYESTPSLWSDDANRFLVEELSDLPPGSALDLGCGEGRNALWLAERGWSVTAVDFSTVAIERAKSLADARSLAVDFHVGDAVHYPVGRGPYDLVVVFYLQLPEDEVRATVRNAAGAVAPEGILLVVAHDLDNLDHGFGGPPMPDVLYTVEMVTEELGGLEVVRAERVERVVVTTDGDRVAIDTLVRAERRVE